MSILDRISQKIAENRGELMSEASEKEAGAEGIANTISSVYARSLAPKMKASEYLKSAKGWVYGCVNVIADEVASIDMFLRQTKNGEEVEVDDHPALDLIYKPNNAMTRFDLINTTFQYLELAGEAPWYVAFTKGKVANIILLRPDRLTVLPGKNGEMIGGYKYKIYGDSGVQEIELEPHEVIPLKYVDPDNLLRGKGPLQAAAETVDLDNFSERWNSQFFQNSASPNAVLQTDKALAKEVRNRLEKKIKEKWTGLDNSHKTLILEQGLKWEKISLSQKDMDFIEQQKFSRDKILSIFRVPKSALGLTEDVNRANAEATDYVFAKRTIKPKMIRFIEQLNIFYLPLFEKTENLYFDFKDPVPENIDQLIKRAESGVSVGYMTINEARYLMGLDPIDGGDDLRDPMSFSPIPSTDEPSKHLKGKTERKIKTARYKVHMNNMRGRGKKEAEAVRETIKKAVTDKLTPFIFSELKKRGSKKHKAAVALPWASGTFEEKKEQKWQFQEKQLNVATQFEEKMIAKLNSVFREQEKIVKHGLDAGEKMTLDVSKETEKYLKALQPVMIQLMREQSRLAFQILGVQRSFEGQDEKALTFLQRLSEYFEVTTFKFATEVTKYTNQKLRDAFAAGTSEGESIAQLKKRVSSLFGDMEGYRSERIARTETIRASNFATEEAYRESGVVEGKEWLATRDERTDDECIELDGKVIPLGKDFKKGGEIVKFPPIHVNCRCTLLPVIER